MDTKLMSKLFSEETSAEFKQKVSDKVAEAKEHGSAELVEGDENLQFAAVEDGIVVEDQANDNEVTLITENEDDPMDLKMEAVSMADEKLDETPAEVRAEEKKQYEEGFQAGEQYREGKEAAEADLAKEEAPKAEPKVEVPAEEVKPEVRKESETEPSVEVDPVKGKDGKHIENTVPEVKVEVSAGVKNAEKAGLKSFSFHFIGASEGYIANTLKTFSEVMDAVEDTVESVEKQEDKAQEIAQPSSEVKEYSDDMPKTEVENDDPEFDKAIEDANFIAEKAEKMAEGDVKAACEVKEMSEKCLEKCKELKDKGHDMKELEEHLITFSEKAAEILDKAEASEDKMGEEKPEVKEETPAEEVETKEMEVSDDQQKQFSACLNTKFDDVSVKPVVKVAEQKTFSTETQPQTQQSINPFLYSKFE